MPRRFLSTAAALAAGSAMALASAGAASASAGAPAAAPATPCATSTVIAIDSFAFSPTQVDPGQSSTANLVTTNCTASSQTTLQTWIGQYISASGTGLPSGCPVIDPLARSVTYSPYQEVLTSTSYLVLSGCKANALKVTVRITGANGVLINQGSATLLIKQ